MPSITIATRKKQIEKLEQKIRHQQECIKTRDVYITRVFPKLIEDNRTLSDKNKALTTRCEELHAQHHEILLTGLLGGCVLGGCFLYLSNTCS